MLGNVPVSCPAFKVRASFLPSFSFLFPPSSFSSSCFSFNTIFYQCEVISDGSLLRIKTMVSLKVLTKIEIQRCVCKCVRWVGAVRGLLKLDLCRTLEWFHINFVGLKMLSSDGLSSYSILRCKHWDAKSGWMLNMTGYELEELIQLGN